MALTNLALRFLLELGGVAAVAIAGHRLTGGSSLGWAVALGGATLFIVTWALVVAPKAANGLSQSRKDAIGTVLLLVAAGGLAAAGWSGPAIGFGSLVVLNAVGLLAFGPEARHRLMGAVR
jgi:hypothetical protein